MNKICSSCEEEKDLNYFCKDRSKQDGLHSICKLCKRKYDCLNFADTIIKKRYGLSTENYYKLFDLQNNKCAICKLEKKLHIDHCHKTGKVRGLLCFGCNAAIGQFNDDTKLLKNAIEYLS